MNKQRRTRYFYDTEFHDDGMTIDFLSIGIVNENGAEYYAVNADADWPRARANDWLAANVINQLPPESEWKPKTQIAAEVKEFLLRDGPPELWAWFAAYDHVVLSQLFGRMLDLPDGVPMFTNDLRSLIDWVNVHKLPQQPSGNHDALEDARHLQTRFDFVLGEVSE